MNAAYAYNTHEAAFLITNRIYYLLEQNQWSVKTLSDKSNIPYETLKKLLSRKTENTSFHNIIKIALAFNCNLNYFVDPMENVPFPQTVNTRIPLYYPKSTAEYKTKRSFDLSRQETVDISGYPKHMQNQIHYGIVISTYAYHPVYTVHDALLVNYSRPPLPGETGIFLHGNKLHIRIFSHSFNSVILEPVNGIGPDIMIRDFTEWKVLGYVVGVHKFSCFL